MAEEKKTNPGAKKKAVKKTASKKKTVASKKKVVKKAAKKKAASRAATASKKKVARKKASVAAAAMSVRKVSDKERYEMIQKHAYFLAEARNFQPGKEHEDWLEAERFIDEMLKKL